MDEPIKNLEEIIKKSRRADIALFLVSNFSKQVLELALLYAHYLVTYGVSITEKHETAVQQKEMLDRAYVRGRNDERETNATKEQREQLDLMRAKAQMNIKSIPEPYEVDSNG